MNDLQPVGKIKKLTDENRKENRKREQQQVSVSYSSAQPRQSITSGPPYTTLNPHLIVPPRNSRTDPLKQPAGAPQHQPRCSQAFVCRRSSRSEHVLSKIRDDALENEVGSSLRNFMFNPGASTSDAPPPQWEAQRPPGIELSSRLPASVVDLCCRALDCLYVCTVINGP